LVGPVRNLIELLILILDNPVTFSGARPGAAASFRPLNNRCPRKNRPERTGLQATTARRIRLDAAEPLLTVTSESATVTISE